MKKRMKERMKRGWREDGEEDEERMERGWREDEGEDGEEDEEKVYLSCAIMLVFIP